MSLIEPDLLLNSVSKNFGASQASVLEGLNLSVKPGEFVVLVGASGCGKTTLLNLIAELDTPTSGVISKRRSATLMFQDSALMPWLSAGKNVELALNLGGLEKKERKSKAQELLKRVNLEQSYEKRPHELSGGMRQRVAIARALAQKSGILLMDEPFAALDAITRDLLHDEITRVWRENGLTIVFVTHNVREAVRLGERVLLMSSRPGRFIKEWTIDIPEPRRIDSSEVALLAREITDELREEIGRHA
jgi:NitT/TauT family transport system ATP-binding protein